VVGTVAAVGYAAGGIGAALLAAFVAFLPSFVVILAGWSRFDRLRGNATARAFLEGAGPAAIGAIAGSSVLLAGELGVGWQYIVLAAAAAALLLRGAASSPCCSPRRLPARWRSSPARTFPGKSRHSTSRTDSPWFGSRGVTSSGDSVRLQDVYLAVLELGP
jgi:hypothetical protein